MSDRSKQDAGSELSPEQLEAVSGGKKNMTPPPPPQQGSGAPNVIDFGGADEFDNGPSMHKLHVT